MDEPLMRRRSSLGPEMAGETPFGHRSLPCEYSKRQVPVQVALRPCQQWREARRFRSHRLRDILGLAAVAMWRDEEPLGDLVGNLRAEILADDVQAQVEAGRAACRRH